MERTNAKYAIQLANIYTAPGSTRIVQSNITDTRLNTERCGAVSSISQFNTTNLYNQIQSDLASFKSTEQAEFQEWFENLRTVLDSNTAAHLQNEIDGLSSTKANKSDITNISITGTTNNTGSNILAGTLFYLNGSLCKTLVNVANGATFTEGTNYRQTTLLNGLAGFSNYEVLYSDGNGGITIYYNDPNGVKALLVRLIDTMGSSLPDTIQITDPKLHPHSRYYFTASNHYDMNASVSVSLTGSNLTFSRKENHLEGGLLYF